MGPESKETYISSESGKEGYFSEMREGMACNLVADGRHKAMVGNGWNDETSTLVSMVALNQARLRHTHCDTCSPSLTMGILFSIPIAGALGTIASSCLAGLAFFCTSKAGKLHLWLIVEVDPK